MRGRGLGLVSMEERLRPQGNEQDHRGIKSRTRLMLGFKSFASAANAIAGIELLCRIYKRQFALSRLRRRGQAAPAIWNAVLCCKSANWLPRSVSEYS